MHKIDATTNIKFDGYPAIYGFNDTINIRYTNIFYKFHVCVGITQSSFDSLNIIFFPHYTKALYKRIIKKKYRKRK